MADQKSPKDIFAAAATTLADAKAKATTAEKERDSAQRRLDRKLADVQLAQMAYDKAFAALK